MTPKYRAWLINQKEMQPVEKMILAESKEPLAPYVVVEGWCELFTLGDEAELLQYIGRTNEDDVEIYTNYIISVIEQGYAMGYYYENEYIGVVKYDHDLCTHYLDLIEKSMFDSVPDVEDGISISKDSSEIERYYFGEHVVPEDIQILGNIYENPELLGSELDD